jgi:hypothetical protein
MKTTPTTTSTTSGQPITNRDQRIRAGGAIMAKEFYSLEEAADVMGVSPQDIKRFVEVGKLTQQESDGKPAFRIEDVERVIANEGSSIVDLAINEDTPESDAKPAARAEPVPLSLDDELTSDINLLGLDESSADLDLGPSPAIEISGAEGGGADVPDLGAGKPGDEIPLASGSDMDLVRLEDSAHDIGLSASDVIALDEDDESPAKSATRAPGPGKAGPKEDTAITNIGISVFDDSDLQIESDPAAKTVITPASEQEIALESIGSGSGLLDLTRESDETSLGAELLDVISPSEGTETETQAEPIDSDTGTLEAEAVDSGSESYYPPAAEPQSALAMAATDAGIADPVAPAFTGLAFISTITLVLVGLAAVSQIQGVWPKFFGWVDSGTNLYIFFAAALAITGLAWLIGWLIGRSGVTQKPPATKPAKPRREQQAKGDTANRR